MSALLPPESNPALWEARVNQIPLPKAVLSGELQCSLFHAPTISASSTGIQPHFYHPPVLIYSSLSTLGLSIVPPTFR